MKNVTVKGLVLNRVEMLREHLVQSLSPAPGSAGGPTPAGLVRRFLSAAETEGVQGADRELVYKVTLDLEGAVPTDDSLDIWVGDQLLVGTLLHEQEQRITGYVRRCPADTTEVRIRYSDGSIKIFPIRTSSG